MTNFPEINVSGKAIVGSLLVKDPAYGSHHLELNTNKANISVQGWKCSIPIPPDPIKHDHPDILGHGKPDVIEEAEKDPYAPLILQPEGGKVGIGISNPDAKLAVEEGIELVGNFRLPGQVSPFIDFHYKGKKPGYDPDATIISDSDRQLSIIAERLRVSGDAEFEGGILELGLNDSTLGARTPLIAFHYRGEKQSNVSITNDADGRLSLVAQSLSVQGEIRMNDHPIWLRGLTDDNYGIGYYGIASRGDPTFAATDLDGPVVFGYGGGALGTNQNATEQIALSWNANGNVGIGKASPEAKLDIQADSVQGVGMIMRDASGAERFRFNTWSNDLIIKDANGNEVLTFNGGNGNLSLPGDILLRGADCAEQFDIAADKLVDAGSVMVIDETGALKPAHQAYDKRVAGVVSGAGDLRPGIILDKQPNKLGRLPLALVGKVYCKVDAEYGAIQVGDLLTTSATLGHAMRVNDPLAALGAVIGKALGALKDGQGLIPILVTLQ